MLFTYNCVCHSQCLHDFFWSVYSMLVRQVEDSLFLIAKSFGYLNKLTSESGLVFFYSPPNSFVSISSHIQYIYSVTGTRSHIHFLLLSLFFNFCYFSYFSLTIVRLEAAVKSVTRPSNQKIDWYNHRIVCN